MEIFRLTTHIILWHYTRGIIDLYHNWMNFIGLVYRVFSLPDLFRTLFSPWRRMGEPYTIPGRGLDPKQFFGALVVNTMTRIVGFFARMIFILIGALLLVATFTLGLAYLVLWLFLPIIAIMTFFIGLNLLIF